MANFKTLSILINTFLAANFGINILRLLDEARMFVLDNNLIINFVATSAYQATILVLAFLKIRLVIIQTKKENATKEPSERKGFFKNLFS